MNLLISFLSADISVAFSLSMLVITVLTLAVVMQLAQRELLDVNNDLLNTLDKAEDVIESMEETIFSLHCDISDMAHDEMANRHYHDMDILKLQDEIKELKLQLEDNKLIASYVPNYFKPMTEEEMAELRKMEL